MMATAARTTDVGGNEEDGVGEDLVAGCGVSAVMAGRSIMRGDRK